MAGNFDPSAMQPSGTGREAISLDDLFSNAPRGKVGALDDYMRLMQYMTQPKRDMGPAGRRAAAGMSAGPRDTMDPVELQQPGGGQGLLAMLFGGLGK